MAMTRNDRFKLKSQLMDSFTTPEWTWEKLMLLFHEFGIDGLEDATAPSVAEIVSGVSDAMLAEMYSIVFQVDAAVVASFLEGAPVAGSWKAGYVRLFISHSARHKEFVAEVSSELAVVGIDGFVAHDAMQYSIPWQGQIEQALGTMDAFVALIHPEFGESPWCHQEVGWALGRRTPRFAVRIGSDPEGFLGREQWPSSVDRSAKEVAAIISSWISGLPELGDVVSDGLLTALRDAGNYMDAGAAAERIASLETLPDDKFAELDRIWLANDQLHGGILPTRAMKPFYKRNGRPWPPTGAHVT